MAGGSWVKKKNQLRGYKGKGGKEGNERGIEKRAKI